MKFLKIYKLVHNQPEVLGELSLLSICLENSKFKPVKLHLKIVLVSHPAHSGVVG